MGARNYRYFLRFLGGLTLYTLVIFLLSSCVMAMQVRYHRDNDEDTDTEPLTGLFDTPTTVFTAAVTFVSVWSLFSLCTYHCYLLSVGETTNENLREVFDAPGVENPWDEGLCCNTVGACCERTVDSSLPDLSREISAAEYVSRCLPGRKEAWVGP